APVVSVGPPDNGITLERVVDEIEERRRALELEQCVIWGILAAACGPTVCASLSITGRRPSPGQFRPVLLKNGRRPGVHRVPAQSRVVRPAGLCRASIRPYDSGATTWQVVDGVGWVFRREGGAALLVSPDPPTAELKRIMPALWAFDSRE